MSAPLIQPAPVPNGSPFVKRPLRPSVLQMSLWGLTILYTLFWYVRHWGTFQIGVWTDDASYTVLARSIVHGPHFGLINIPHGSAPTRYPCGFPLLLVPFTLAFPHSLNALTLLPLLSTLGGSALLFWGWPGFSRRGSYWWGLAVASLYLLTPLTLGETVMVMSEPEFTLASLGAVWLTGRLMAGRKDWGTIFAWSALLLLTVLIRTVGLVIIVTAFACLILAQRRSAAKTIALGLAGMSVCLSLLLLATDVRLVNLLPGEYVQQLNDPSAFGQQQASGSLAERLLDGIRDYAVVDLRQSVLPFGGGQKEALLWQRLHLPNFSGLLGVLTTLLIALGLGRGLMRDSWSPFWLSAILSFGILLVWPWHGPRFLFPIQPQIYFAWLLGLEGLLEGLASLMRARQEPSRPALAAVAAVCLLMVLAFVWHGMKMDNSRRHTGDFALFNAWIQTHTPPNAVLLCAQPQTDYLYSDRKTLPFTDIHTQADLEHLAATHEINDIFLAPDLFWQEQYTPRYSAQTQQIGGWLNAAPLKSQVSVAYSSPRDGITVYHVLP